MKQSLENQRRLRNWKKANAEHPLWSAFAEMVRNSDFLARLVRIWSEFQSESQNSEICHSHNDVYSWWNCIGMLQSQALVWYNRECYSW